jgi:Ras-related protein Rab-18
MNGCNFFNKKKQMRLRFVIVGPSYNGKSSLTTRYTQDKFDNEHMMTIGLEYKIKKTTVDNVNIDVQIWDTGGLECFQTITHIYYEKSCAALCVFDVNNKESLLQMETTIKDAQRLCPSYAIVALVANKIDLQRKITSQEGQHFANLHNIPYYEVSSKTGQGVDNMFDDILKSILQKIKNHEFVVDAKPITVTIEPNPYEKQKGCCCIS